jgi:hypothetical protein
MSAARSIGVNSRDGAGVCGCVCAGAPRPAVDPVRCIPCCGPDGILNVGGRLKPAFDGVRAGAGVFGKSPGVGRKGVTGGYDILLVDRTH